ncbi:hypothetical protein [Bacillus sp. XF8]|uniref:hypothetical protein n=1 Tax=Bacillus sp. XF8 TaxID=2819289 RepID=UPI001AA059C4|nr:hypothetical protein [Bacillus sp. XF8]MBO1583142.1 hypothetical protein [Bacillus sp. XF8]
MKKKQVNIFEEFAKAGEEIAERLKKENPFVNMFDEIKNEKLEELYQNYKNIAEPLFQLKRALIDSGFSEEQALEFVIADYLDNKHIAMNEGK